MTKDELLKKLNHAKSIDDFSSVMFNDLVRYFNAPIEPVKAGDECRVMWDLIIHVVTVSEVKNQP